MPLRVRPSPYAVVFPMHVSSLLLLCCVPFPMPDQVASPRISLQFPDSPLTFMTLICRLLQPMPRHVLAGHGDALTCLATDAGLDLVISAAADGVLLFHSLRTGR